MIGCRRVGASRRPDPGIDSRRSVLVGRQPAPEASEPQRYERVIAPEHRAAEPVLQPLASSHPLAGHGMWGTSVKRTGTEPDAARCEPVVLWWLGERRFAVPLHAVLEVTPVAAVSEPPDHDGSHLGHLDLRGASVPGFDARRLLGMEGRTVALSDRFLIVRAGTERVALLVDRVEGIATACTEPDSSVPGTGSTGVRLARLQQDPDAGSEALLVQVLDLPALLARAA